MPRDEGKTRSKEQDKAEKAAAKAQEKLNKAVTPGDLRPNDVSEQGSGTPVAVPVDSAKTNTSPNQTLHTPPKE